MRQNYFSTPNEIFSLGLSPGEFAAYSFLCRCENRRTHQCWPSYSTIGAATSTSINTVRKQVYALTDKGLIRACCRIKLYGTPHFISKEGRITGEIAKQKFKRA